MRRTRESAASPPAVLVRAATCRSARLPVRCSGLGQPGNGLLKVLDRRPHLDGRSMLASRPGRVTPARHSPPPAIAATAASSEPYLVAKARNGIVISTTEGCRRFDVDVSVLSTHRQLSHRLSVVHETTAIPVAARPPVHPQGSGKHGAAVRDVAPPTAAGAHSPRARGSRWPGSCCRSWSRFIPACGAPARPYLLRRVAAHRLLSSSGLIIDVCRVVVE